MVDFAVIEVEEGLPIVTLELDQRPDDAQAAFQLGMARFGVEEHAEAAEAFARAAQLDPSRKELPASQAVSLMRAGDFPAAAEAVRVALQRFSDSPDLHATLGAALLGMGRLGEARSEHG